MPNENYFFLFLLIHLSVHPQQKGLVTAKAMVVSVREEASRMGVC